MTDDAYPHLFEPLMLSGKRLRNRIVHASITLRRGRNQAVTDSMLEYYEARARGGAALIVTEPLATARHQHIDSRIRCWDDSETDSLKRLADSTESHDCRLLGQIQDAGRGRHAPGRNTDAVGAAPLPDDLSYTVPHVLTIAEIRAMIADFAASAAQMQRCGLSGAEISAGHGHLFHQFMSPWSNNRADEYGGDFEGRLRFMVEMIDATRAATGDDFILGLKLPGDDGVQGGIGPDLAAAIARRLTESGKASYICFAQGAHHRSLEMHIPDGHEPPVTYAALIRNLRKAIPGVPVVALGRITDPAEAEAILVHGEAEMVGLGRPLITDPEWPRKAAEGRARDIRYCVSGNTCWGNSQITHQLHCENNPRVAARGELAAPARVAQPKTIVVVGSGVAGLEAALAAAERGHRVTVLGRSGEVGGKTRLHAQLPGSEQLSSIYDYQSEAARRAGVRFELDVDAGADDVIGLAPDAVVLATGSTMIWPRVLPDELREEGFVPDLRGALGEILRRREHQHGAAVIFDMDNTDGTYAAAELLHQLFDRVVIICPRESIAQETALVTRQGILRRFSRKGIEVAALSEPRWSDTFENEGRLEYVHVYSGQVDSVPDVAFFAYSTPRIPNDALLAPLRAAGLAVHAIGDCRVARGPLAATTEGYAVGHTI